MLKKSYRAIAAATVLFIFLFLFLSGIWKMGVSEASNKIDQQEDIENMSKKIIKTDAEWRKILTEEEYLILRKKGTERAFTGKYNNFKGQGIFKCAGCGNQLFGSDTKYDSGSGWPSFWAPISASQIQLEKDHSLFMARTEVLCSKCGGHLGHVFDDGPSPTHQRYCINSASLNFEDLQNEGDSLKNDQK